MLNLYIQLMVHYQLYTVNLHLIHLSVYITYVYVHFF